MTGMDSGAIACILDITKHSQYNSPQLISDGKIQTAVSKCEHL